MNYVVLLTEYRQHGAGNQAAGSRTHVQRPARQAGPARGRLETSQRDGNNLLFSVFDKMEEA
jgi:hypothetical protein